MTDVIMTEMHAIKDDNAQKYRGRYSAMLKDLQKRQEASVRTIIRIKTAGRRGRAGTQRPTP